MSTKNDYDRVFVRAGGFLVFLSLVVWQAETAYFGFNLRPQSLAERCWDAGVTALFITGFGMRYRVSIRRRDQA